MAIMCIILVLLEEYSFVSRLEMCLTSMYDLYKYDFQRILVWFENHFLYLMLNSFSIDSMNWFALVDRLISVSKDFHWFQKYDSIAYGYYSMRPLISIVLKTFADHWH